MPAIVYCILILAFMVLVVVVICCSGNDDDHRAEADQPAPESAEQRVDDQPASPVVLSAEQRLARAWAQWQASAASAEALLAARAEAVFTGQVAAPAPPVLLPLPYSPYAAQRPQSDKPAETTTTVVEYPICLDPLRPGQLCNEVPPCRHVFHGDCLGEWARSNGSCPLCRAKIVPGSEEVAIADDMVYSSNSNRSARLVR